MRTHPLPLAVLTLIALSASTVAQDSKAADVKLTKEANRVRVEVGGTHFTDYYFGDDAGGPYVRPFAYPVLAADGTPVTSDQKTAPPVNGKKADHPHHRSLWVSHGAVNGADHWALAGENPPKQRHVGLDRVEGDTIVQQLVWEGKDHQPMLKETRTLRFFGLDEGSRGIDVTSVFTPVGGPVTFADTKEAGLCSVRVVKSISDKPTLTNSEGQTGEKAMWGKKAAWCDISGQVNGKPYGVAIFDHPRNPRHPSNWHVREYGLMAANVFGLHDYDTRGTPKGAGDWTIQPGETKTFKYRVIVHQGDAKAAKLDEKYKAFAGESERG